MLRNDRYLSTMARVPVPKDSLAQCQIRGPGYIGAISLTYLDYNNNYVLSYDDADALERTAFEVSRMSSFETLVVCLLFYLHAC